MDPVSHPSRDSAKEPVLRSRLLPRVSFQAMLLLTTLCGIVFAVAFSADQGFTYAAAALTGITFLVALFLLMTFFFVISWALSHLPKICGLILVVMGFLFALLRLVGLRYGLFGVLTDGVWLLNFQFVGWVLLLSPIGKQVDDDAHSPFADDQLPPQILAPRDSAN